MKKFLKSTWMVFVLPLLVTIIGGLILTMIEDIDLFSGIGKFLNIIESSIVKFLTIKVSLWAILLVIIILFIFLIIVNKIIIKTEKNQTTTKKLYEEYIEDYYDDLKYKWKWNKGYDGLYISDIYPICECGCSFNYDMFDSKLQCPDCKKIYKNNVDTDSAKRVFINRYNKKLKSLLMEKQNVK